MNAPKAKREPSGRIAIFNIDGCISDDRWRRARVPEDASVSADFEAYHAGADDDPPLAYGAAILQNHISNGDFIVFATGRDMSSSERTAQWIRKHFGIEPNNDFIILMRGPGDKRSVVHVKADYARYLLDSFCVEREKTVVAAYDNRRDVVSMYRHCGWEATILNEDGEFVPQDIVEVKTTITKAPPFESDSGALSFMPDSTLCEATPSAFLGEKMDSTNLFVNVEQGNSNANPIPEVSNARKYPKYFKDVSGIDELDVYLLLEIFDVQSHAIGHAIKKLLLRGERTGGKSAVDDVKEARDTLNRWLEIRSKFV